MSIHYGGIRRVWGPHEVDDNPLVSIFTATHNIGRGIDVPFHSLLRQTYPHWEWVIADDSTEPTTAVHIETLADAPASAGRIRLYRQYPPPGSIGASKAAAAALGRGECLIELDHDDELRPEALEIVAATFTAHPEIDFVYSDWIDWIETADGGGVPGRFPAGWAFGFGGYASEVVDGRRLTVALAPPLTWETVRHIVSAPNHLRAWRTSFYRDIGGYDHRLPLGEDFELVARTFLRGTAAHIPRPLYIQHFHPDGSNTSRHRNPEIQQRVAHVMTFYQEAIDERCRQLGLYPGATPPWSSATPIAAASARIDVVAEAAADLGVPFVSVVIPTFERPDLLRRAIASALGQTYPNLEVLVVGDACSVVDAVVGDIDDPRLRHENLATHAGDGGATPRNYALMMMARGSLIAYLDDDNWWEPDHVQSLVELLRADPAASFAFSSFEVAGEIIECRTPRRMQIDTSALLHRRRLLERYGYWQPTDAVGYAHDWELVSRWTGEPWRASLRPTLHYNMATSQQELATVELMRQVATEERQSAQVGLPG